MGVTLFGLLFIFGLFISWNDWAGFLWAFFSTIIIVMIVVIVVIFIAYLAEKIFG
jgi:hypothetical protein